MRAAIVPAENALVRYLRSGARDGGGSEPVGGGREASFPVVIQPYWTKSLTPT